MPILPEPVNGAGEEQAGPASDGSEPDLEREVRQARKYSMEDAIGRLAGPGSLKGASPVSRQQQAENEIRGWLGSNVEDPAGALRLVLARQMVGSPLLLDDLDRPLTVLARYCQSILESESKLRELVRETDVEWARLMGERPHLELAGSSPHADDPYTIAGVRTLLQSTVRKLDE